MTRADLWRLIADTLRRRLSLIDTPRERHAYTSKPTGRPPTGAIAVRRCARSADGGQVRRPSCSPHHSPRPEEEHATDRKEGRRAIGARDRAHRGGGRRHRRADRPGAHAVEVGAAGARYRRPPRSAREFRHGSGRSRSGPDAGARSARGAHRHLHVARTDDPRPLRPAQILTVERGDGRRVARAAVEAHRAARPGASGPPPGARGSRGARSTRCPRYRR